VVYPGDGTEEMEESGDDSLDVLIAQALLANADRGTSPVVTKDKGGNGRVVSVGNRHVRLSAIQDLVARPVVEGSDDNGRTQNTRQHHHHPTPLHDVSGKQWSRATQDTDEGGHADAPPVAIDGREAAFPRGTGQRRALTHEYALA